ncbi:MAG TPA: LicD family protein [Erysipelotrichaceae bacterium]|nr:LicD family protein [Erysipelotrichaceae bacterium]
MEYMRDNLEDKYGILVLQNKILEIAVYIEQFCTQYDIDYCLMGGSALGAKRHGGFIPWDDDLDIFMTPDNYEKFREKFVEFGDHEKFYLQEYGRTKKGHVTVSKLRMNGTTYIEDLTKDWDIHQGIFVDIFILHNCPNSKIKQLWQCFWAKCAVVKGMSMRGYNRQTGLRKFLLWLSKLLPRKLMVDFALRQVYRYRNVESDYYCNFLGKAVYKKGLYKKEWFNQTEHFPFEKAELRVPVGLHEFLTERFGDYMIPPSEERIKWEQHALHWDTEKHFSTANKNDFLDEKKLV